MALQGTIDDILILHLENGKDSFVGAFHPHTSTDSIQLVISGTFKKTCFGTQLEALLQSVPVLSTQEVNCITPIHATHSPSNATTRRCRFRRRCGSWRTSSPDLRLPRRICSSHQATRCKWRPSAPRSTAASCRRPVGSYFSSPALNVADRHGRAFGGGDADPVSESTAGARGAVRHVPALRRVRKLAHPQPPGDMHST